MNQPYNLVYMLDKEQVVEPCVTRGIARDTGWKRIKIAKNFNKLEDIGYMYIEESLTGDVVQTLIKDRKTPSKRSTLDVQKDIEDNLAQHSIMLQEKDELKSKLNTIKANLDINFEEFNGLLEELREVRE